jgi:hypothetical protein
MKQKSSKSLGTGVGERSDPISKMSAEQAVEASTKLKVEVTRLPKPVLKNPKTLGQEHLNEAFADFDFEIEEGARDNDMGRRVYEVEGVKYRIRQVNPHSLWEVVGDKSGALPAELQGRFTNVNELQRAMSQWQARKSARGSINKAHRAKLEEAGFFDEVTE